MSSIPVFVGLDYHQNSIQICVLDSSGKVLVNRSIANEVALVAKISCQQGVPQRMAIEACCGAAELAEALVTDWQLPVQMAHPGYVNRMKQSPDKTDFGDARMLGDLARVNYIPKVWLAPRETRELRRLVRHRSQLVARRKDTKLRIRGLLRENRLKCLDANAWTVAWLGWLTEEAELRESDRWVLEDHLAELTSLKERIAQVEARIRSQVKDDAMVLRLMDQPGVGLITAVTFRAEVGRVDRFHSGKQLARFCGVTPRNASSGARQADAGLIKAGNPELRKVLIELAQRLLWTSNRWSDLGGKLLRRGKRKTVVVAAIANRWVRWLYHELQRPVSVTDNSDSAPAQQKESAPCDFAIAST
jgi:transposase